MVGFTLSHVSGRTSPMSVCFTRHLIGKVNIRCWKAQKQFFFDPPVEVNHAFSHYCFSSSDVLHFSLHTLNNRTREHKQSIYCNHKYGRHCSVERNCLQGRCCSKSRSHFISSICNTPTTVQQRMLNTLMLL